MITTLIMVSLALVWLLFETNWMMVRLPADESIEEYDRRILAEMELEQQRKDLAYQDWLDRRYLQGNYTKYSRFQDPAYTDNPQDKWMAVREDQVIRQRGEAIYQR